MAVGARFVNHPRVVRSAATGVTSAGAAGVVLIARAANQLVAPIQLLFENRGLSDRTIIVTEVDSAGVHADIGPPITIGGGIGNHERRRFDEGELFTARDRGLGFRLTGAGTDIVGFAIALRESGIAGS